jgi:sterol desaturase/sphingolipid hydroxylase (fatty acid hydroxylase superfamily)
MTFVDKIERSVEAFVGGSMSQLFWYAVMAGGVWLAFYVVFRSAMRHRRISRHQVTRWQIPREIAYSIRSIAIFGLVAAGIFLAAVSGVPIQLYRPIDKYGWAYFVLSIALMIALHDTYFYWTHRLMHHRRLFRLFHYTHHRSVSPTPWAAYSFSTLEAAVQGGIGPLILFTIPCHGAAFGLFMLWQISFNVFGHCGYEIYPRSFVRSPAGWVMNSITHHVQHHEKPRGNFGLYFNVWDRLMGTNHRDYEERFEQAAGAAADDRSRHTPCAVNVGQQTECVY